MHLRFMGGPGPQITYNGRPLQMGDVVSDEWLAGDERFQPVAGPASVIPGWCDQHPRPTVVTAEQIGAAMVAEPTPKRTARRRA